MIIHSRADMETLLQAFTDLGKDWFNYSFLWFFFSFYLCNTLIFLETFKSQEPTLQTET